MYTYVKGVRIELTKEQEELVNKELAKRERSHKSLTSVLKEFGFKKCDGGFLQHDHGWFAMVQDQGNYHEVWVTGKCLKAASSFPGGWCYSDSKVLYEELNNGLQKLTE